MKKLFLLGAMVCALGMMAACKNESDTHTVILKTEEPSLTVVEIGDGSNYYCEPISIGGDEHYVIHSTLACPKIDKGVQRNCYKMNGYNNIFCPTCMNDLLISLWKDRFFPNGYKSN